jgi:type I restriction-modification system DNA methylase subunit
MKEFDLESFIEYFTLHIKGDEKSEAQIFLDHFFMALGYTDGLKGAGAECEFRIKGDKKGSTQFADLVWKPRVLIEMKKRGVDLSLHYQQAFDYWTKLVPDRPQYVILCNFDEFWIYDLNINVYSPLEKIETNKLNERREAFSFLLPRPRAPIFDYNKENVTEKAAKCISFVYNSIRKREKPDVALKYCLQIVLSLFAEDIDLLPDQIFTRIINELDKEKTASLSTIPKSFDLIGGLFQAMNTEGITAGGYFKGVDYFNGGLFDSIYPIELTEWEIDQIKTAVMYNWRNVNPAIFGSIFETVMDEKERHKLGAHYTHEIDIKKIVVPVIVQPWNEKIENAAGLDDFYLLIEELSQFKVLDPACGSGNFLFIAFKEMKMIEKRLLQLIRDHSVKPVDAKRLVKFLVDYKYVTTDQFYGLDIKPFAVELAKVTLMIAKELTWLEAKEAHDNKYKPLPLDNLDNNILCTDALLNYDGTPKQWPEADAIIGNPPYQSKNKMLTEFGGEYLNKLWNAYPAMNKYADFCTYWFYKAHNHLKQGSYAGLVGTNTIRQNNSRESSLDHIVSNGGTIIDAVSSQNWSGEAAVFVSIVNWKKGAYDGDKNLWLIDERNQLICKKPYIISSSLSSSTDVSSAKVLICNTKPKTVFQGQTHGHEGFLLTISEAMQLLKENPEYSQILRPFLIGDELVANYKSQPKRFVIDFSGKDLIEASSYKKLFKQIEKTVLPWRKEMAEKQQIQNEVVRKKNPKAKISKDYINAYNNWWLLRRQKEDMLSKMNELTRYIACARVTQRSIFEFVSSKINPNDKVMCFAFEDDYSFGVIQSKLHWNWFLEKCTTLGETPNYNTAAIWDTFPWPQNPSDTQIEKVAQAAVALRNARNEYMQKNKLSLRDLYRTLEKPGKNPIRDLHTALDKAVIEAYGFEPEYDLLEQLLELNESIAWKEECNEEVQGPGIPKTYTGDISKLVTEDCVEYIEKL